MDWVVKFKSVDPSFIKVFVLDEADVMIDTQVTCYIFRIFQMYLKHFKSAH